MKRWLFIAVLLFWALPAVADDAPADASAEKTVLLWQFKYFEAQAQLGEANAALNRYRAAEVRAKLARIVQAEKNTEEKPAEAPDRRDGR